MEAKGFKNAPNINYWAVGMEFRWLDATYRVCHVSGDRQRAVGILIDKDKTNDTPYPWRRSFGQFEDRQSATLDLGSIWEGREYRVKGSGTRDCVVRIVGERKIGFAALDGPWNHIWTREAFLDRYEPVPLYSAAQVQSESRKFKKGDTIVLHGKVKAEQDMGYHEFDFGPEGKEFRVAGILPEQRLELAADGYGEYNNYGNGRLFVTFEDARKASTAPVQLEKEKWRPEIGKECEWFDFDKQVPSIKVVPVCHDEKEGLWVCRKTGTAIYEGILGSCLRPLPSTVEPPVRHNDMIRVDWPNGQFLLGISVCVDRDIFTLAAGRDTIGNLIAPITARIKFSDVKITHLQPVPNNIIPKEQP